MDEPNNFTHIGVNPVTRRKIAILAQVHGVKIFKLAEILADAAWEAAREAGLVTDAALETREQLVRVGEVELDIRDGKKLLAAIKLPKTKKTSKKAVNS